MCITKTKTPKRCIGSRNCGLGFKHSTNLIHLGRDVWLCERCYIFYNTIKKRLKGDN